MNRIECIEKNSPKNIEKIKKYKTKTKLFKSLTTNNRKHFNQIWNYQNKIESLKIYFYDREKLTNFFMKFSIIFKQLYPNKNMLQKYG